MGHWPNVSNRCIVRAGNQRGLGAAARSVEATRAAVPFRTVEQMQDNMPSASSPAHNNNEFMTRESMIPSHIENAAATLSAQLI